MTKNELYEKIEALEEEIEELEEQLAEVDRYKALDKAQKEVVYMAVGFVNAFMDQGLIKEDAIEFTKIMLQAAARS